MDFSSLPTIIAFVVTFCAVADLSLSKKEKENIQHLLIQGWVFLENSSLETSLRRSANNIINVFDIVYGKKHFSIRCYKASAFVSAFVVLLMYFLFSKYLWKITHSAYLVKGGSANSYSVPIISSLLINCNLDFFFLAKSRVIIGFAKKLPSLTHPFLCLGDIYSSFVLYYVIMFLPSLFSGSLNNYFMEVSLTDFMKDAISYFLVGPFNIYSTFFNDSVYNKSTYLTMFISIISTLSTSLIFGLYNLFSLFSLTLGGLKNRILYMMENFIDSKMVITSLGTIITLFIMLAKIFIHYL